MFIKEFSSFQNLQNYIAGSASEGRYFVKRDETRENRPAEYYYTGVELIPISADGSKVGVIQITKMNRVAGQVDVLEYGTNSKTIIDPYKLFPGEEGVITLHRDFNNADASNFDYDERFVIFDGKMRLKNEVEIQGTATEIDDGYVIEFDLSELSDFDLLGLQVIEG